MRRFVLVLACAVTVLTACSPSAAPPTIVEAGQRLYVSVGDSYATGVGPNGTSEGFAQIVARQSGLGLVNLACNGATSADLLTQEACEPEAAGRTQVDEAADTLRSGQVDLVTMVIGGNDLLEPCAVAQDPMDCATSAFVDTKTNIATALTRFREVAPNVKIVGLSYPDVFLGAWVNPALPDGEALARTSVALYEDFNREIAAEYAKFGATFVDVTGMTGGYGALTELTEDPKYGQIPASVAEVCAFTYYCDDTDVHPTPAGHQAIADAVIAAGRGTPPAPSSHTPPTK
ncbi:GDSL-type esterase/lipase family protein [Lentzea sp. BCCO 10_0856]|uniref:GDSL-type esterase/lipase family protein n=1 Tax=Lentzea miocenica TaxID=3095431 RepID=A0ABU4SSU3_9PSEU|nr:GDSL-type esterase/lipase family protein [Lentzea sp. BCCO 10_0856]MDX8028965.1 GDSL-type esterase/lipase family protein [Lentzea sp. BCCO 10_0856]